MTGKETDGSREWFSTPRRDVLRAVGVGGALAVLGGGGVVSAQEDDGTDGESGTGSDAGQVDGAGTVHEVVSLVGGPPTHPDRPADFYYDPTGLHVGVGDVLKFVAATPDHNLTSYHPALGMQRRVPVGVDPIRTPIMGWHPDAIPDDMIDPPGEPGGAPGGDGGEGGDGSDGGEESPPDLVPESFLYQFEVPGVYDFLCSPHEQFGMVLRVVVGDVTEAPFDTSDPNALPEPRAGPVGLARQALTDPALEPAAIVEAGTVAFADLEFNSGNTDGTSAGGEGGGGSDGQSNEDDNVILIRCER